MYDIGKNNNRAEVTPYSNSAIVLQVNVAGIISTQTLPTVMQCRCYRRYTGMFIEEVARVLLDHWVGVIGFFYCFLHGYTSDSLRYTGYPFQDYTANCVLSNINTGNGSTSFGVMCKQ